MAPAALIFDVDGTLAETEHEGHRPAFNEAFREAGLDWRWDEDLYGELLAVTGGKERIRRYIERHRPGFRPPAGVSLDELVARLHRAKNAAFARRVREGALGLRPGVARLLGEARAAGVPLAIATTTSPENVEALLRHTLGAEAPGWFDVVVAGDMVSAKKPSPEVYERAVQALGVDTGRCVAFEDSAHGVAAARGAGVPVVVTPSHYTRGEDFDGALLVVEHLGEPGSPARVFGGTAAARVGPRCVVDLALLARLLAGTGASAGGAAR